MTVLPSAAVLQQTHAGGRPLRGSLEPDAAPEAEGPAAGAEGACQAGPAFRACSRLDSSSAPHPRAPQALPGSSEGMHLFQKQTQPGRFVSGVRLWALSPEEPCGERVGMTEREKQVSSRDTGKWS